MTPPYPIRNEATHALFIGEVTPPVPHVFVAGDTLASLSASPRLAIVGSRSATPYGLAVATSLSRELAKAGVTIISGLAMGIDAAAHKGCLEGGGRTIAVLTHGLDSVHPGSHTSLAQRIVGQGGALVSEYSPGITPYKAHFIARNRIIAGLAEAVLIIEAPRKSGSLHTADFALEQGKTIFVVPGNITSPSSEGSNTLIKNGATPVTCAENIIQAMKWQPAPTKQASLPLGISPDETTLLRLINSGTHEVSDLLNKSHLPFAKLQQTITLLEVAGHIYSPGNNTWHPC